MEPILGYLVIGFLIFVSGMACRTFGGIIAIIVGGILVWILTHSLTSGNSIDAHTITQIAQEASAELTRNTFNWVPSALAEMVFLLGSFFARD